MTDQPAQTTYGIHRELAEQMAAALSDPDAFRELPIPIRATMVGLVLAATARPVNQTQLAEAGDYSRTTAIRAGGWSDEITTVCEHAAAFVERVTADTRDPEDPTHLRRELDKAHAEIAELRRDLAELREHVNPLISYARDVTVELREYREEERAELDAKLIPLPSPDED